MFSEGAGLIRGPVTVVVDAITYFCTTRVGTGIVVVAVVSVDAVAGGGSAVRGGGGSVSVAVPIRVSEPGVAHALVHGAVAVVVFFVAYL